LRRFELPPAPVREQARRGDVILQPDFSPEVRILKPPQLPNVFLWSQREVPRPERHLRTFSPGEPKPVRRNPQALPDAMPQLRVPNAALAVRDLAIAPMAAAPERPKLPVFEATTTPVRFPRRTTIAPSELPVTGLPQGEGVNLLALMERPAPPASAYQVEGGNRMAGEGADAAGGGAGRTSGASAGGGGEATDAGTAASGAGGPGGGDPAGPGSGRGAGAGAGTSAGTGTGAGMGAGAGTGTGTGTGTGAGAGPGTGVVSGGGGAGGRSGPGSGAAGSGTGSRPGGVGIDSGVPGLRISGGSVPIRTATPERSNFDVVVVNQSTREILPQGAGVLTGQPVYTVYMAVPGSRREWILQYCMPNSRLPIHQQSSNTVRIGGAVPVRAPFPLRKAPLDLGEHRGRAAGRVVVYGSISEKGTVEDLRVIVGVLPEVDVAVVASLRQFLFRPAARDGVPVLVEALFGVPLDGSPPQGGRQ
jgi:hypothetical protein